MINKQMSLNLAYLYPKSMNIYGDRGNVITLVKRCQWRNINILIDEIEVEDNFNPTKYDLVFSGGGQDIHQLRIADDLQSKKKEIIESVSRGTVFLLICGTYQLFGHYFITSTNNKIPGIEILDITTVASKIKIGKTKRMIGNVITEITIPNFKNKITTLVGFENHSGMTFINKNSTTTSPLGRVIKGFGNNGEDKTEGAYYKNVFGTYLHGSLLPKNPHFADFLIKTALENKYKIPIKLDLLNDDLENTAHQFILNRR